MNHPEYNPVTACRGCGHTGMLDVVHLGNQHVVDFIDAPAKSTRPVAPLTLCFCGSCSLLQLRHSVNPDLMYRTFWYKSGMNESMVRALTSVTEKATMLTRLQPADWVLDIGANDGTLLDTYKVKGVTTVGVEPASNFAENSRHAWVQSYFSEDIVRAHFADRQFKVITAIAMFYDLENPLQFLQDCRALLDPNGLLIIQMNYLPAMLRNMAFDNISHEHLTYFSLTSLLPLIQRAGLEILSVSENDVNGGSLRVYIQRPLAKLAGYGHDHVDYWKALQRAHDTVVLEEREGFDRPSTFIEWGQSVHVLCRSIRTLVANARDAKKRVALYGASTRGSTLMQTMYPALTWDCAPFPFAAERDEAKIGLRTAGYKVPIISEEAARKLADVFLVLPWHFREAILEREKSWLDAGGTFIFPLPTPEVVDAAYLRRMEKAKEKQTAMEAGG